ncbi:hypothetical protein G6F37_010255 [Rhizopus arrhizus]|nr:hypothetical protein G6F38_010278 [Rhizopus arrhizus]KAG1153553.1 hypothetical protein G6F37_010255 [Rhizopus arrhizus]
MSTTTGFFISLNTPATIPRSQDSSSRLSSPIKNRRKDFSSNEQDVEPPTRQDNSNRQQRSVTYLGKVILQHPIKKVANSTCPG